MVSRINLILKIKNLTASQFADEIGVQRSSMSHILSGRNNPSLDFISKVLLRYPDICTDWLLFGKGEIYDSGIQNVTRKQENILSKELDLFSEEYTEKELNNKANELEENTETLELSSLNTQSFINENRKNKKDIESVNEYSNLAKEKKIKKLMILYTDNTYEEFILSI